MLRMRDVVRTALSGAVRGAPGVKHDSTQVPTTSPGGVWTAVPSVSTANRPNLPPNPTRASMGDRPLPMAVASAAALCVERGGAQL